jgi:hypothetical protein
MLKFLQTLSRIRDYADGVIMMRTAYGTSIASALWLGFAPGLLPLILLIASAVIGFSMIEACRK